MLKLRSIELKNWCRVKEAKLDFPDSGLVFVTGPIGVGKTSLGEAIFRTLFGAGGRYTGTGDYSFNGDGDTSVRLTAADDTGPVEVLLGYKHAAFDSAGEGLRFSIGGETVERPRATQTRQELCERLQVSPTIVPWTLFLDGETLKFHKVSQADSVNLLLDALNQPRWSAYHEKAKSQAALLAAAANEKSAASTRAAQAAREAAERFEQASDSLAAARQAYASALQEHADIKQAHDDQVGAASSAVDTAAAAVDKIKKQIDAAQKADAEQYGRLEVEASQLGSERRQAVATLNGWEVSKAKLETELSHARLHAESLAEGKVCRQCQRPLGEKPDPAAVAKAKAAVAALQKKLTGHAETLAKCRSVISEIDADVAANTKAREKLRSATLGKLSDELAVAETRLNQAERRFRTAESQRASLREPSDSVVKAAEAACQVVQETLAKRNQEAGDAAKAAAAALQEHKVASYWATAFSPTGIPNKILRQAIGPLNNAARLVSEAVSGGKISVIFSAESELASGQVKPKLVTSVINREGAKTLNGNSKGEAGLANLIVAETQAKVGRVLQRVGFRWFDEALNSQDPVVRQHFYAYLKKQCQETSTLAFVVDHAPNISDYADHVLSVDKVGGFTEFRWET